MIRYIYCYRLIIGRDGLAFDEALHLSNVKRDITRHIISKDNINKTTRDSLFENPNRVIYSFYKECGKPKMFWLTSRELKELCGYK